VASYTRVNRAVTTSDDMLTAELAELVLGWRAAPGRFIKSGRSWIPRWRFRPFHELADAFQLLERVADCFSLTGTTKKGFIAEVQVADRRGKASGKQIARTVTTAVARALGLRV
jgi:hypothetical protein